MSQNLCFCEWAVRAALVVDGEIVTRQQQDGQRENTSWEGTSGSLPRTDSHLRSRFILKSGYQGGDGSAHGLQHPLAPPVGYIPHATSPRAAAVGGGWRLQGSCCRRGARRDPPRQGRTLCSAVSRWGWVTTAWRTVWACAARTVFCCS